MMRTGLPGIFAAGDCVITHPVTTDTQADDHRAYYSGSHRIAIRVTGRLLGMQFFGHQDAEIAKRVDIAAAPIFHSMTVDAVSDLDLSYTPPLGSPWGRCQDRRPGLGPPDPAILNRPVLPTKRHPCQRVPHGPAQSHAAQHCLRHRRVRVVTRVFSHAWFPGRSC
jgi:hypothetical protein